MNSLLKVVSSIMLVAYYWLESIVLAFVPKRLRYKDVSGETVLITGAGSGIGRLLALKFAGLRARVVVWDINEKGAQGTVEEIRELGGEAFSYRCDISDPKDVYEQAARVKDEVGIVTILINNAGIVSGKRFLDIPDSMIKKTFEVNVMAHFWTCKAFLPDMISSDHGHIVSIASMAGLSGVVRLSDYCASKFAAVGFEESLRMELHMEGHKGIKSTVVCPYFINTGMFEGAKPGVFTMMTPEYVADEIVSAVLVNQEVLILPKIFLLLLVMRSIMPANALKEALAMLNISSSMFDFSGRATDDTSKSVQKMDNCTVITAPNDNNNFAREGKIHVTTFVPEDGNRKVGSAETKNVTTMHANGRATLVPHSNGHVRTPSENFRCIEKLSNGIQVVQ